MSMSKRIGKREAFRLAARSAAGLIENMDLLELYGLDGKDEEPDQDRDQILAEAQTKVVERIRRMAGE